MFANVVRNGLPRSHLIVMSALHFKKNFHLVSDRKIHFGKLEVDVLHFCNELHVIRFIFMQFYRKRINLSVTIETQHGSSMLDRPFSCMQCSQPFQHSTPFKHFSHTHQYNS